MLHTLLGPRLALALVALTVLASCEKEPDVAPQAPGAPAAQSQDFRGPESVRGVNVNQEYGTVDFAAIKRAGFNTVRIIIRTDIQVYRDRGFGNITQMMRAAKAQNLSVVLTLYRKDYMDAYNPNATYNATQWWLGKLDELKQQNIDYAINLLNEPRAAPTAQQWSNQQTNAVQRLRSNGFTGPIILDAPGYAHETAFVRAEGRNVAPNNTNVVFALHVYPNTFYNGGLPTDPNQDVRFMEDLRRAANRSVIIGEFGDTGGSQVNQRARVQQFVQHAQASTANSGAIGWAWNGDGLGMNARDDAGYLNWLTQTARQ